MIELLKNRWGLGPEETDRNCPQQHDSPANFTPWTTNGRITASKCGRKNPHPDPPGYGGAAFKNGPERTHGGGVPGQWAEMTQAWTWDDMAQAGISPAAAYLMTFETQLISVGGTQFTVDLFGKNAPDAWEHLAAFVNWPSSPPLRRDFWDVFGSTAVVPHYSDYMLKVRSLFQSQLGQKWAGLSLRVDQTAPTPQPDPSPAEAERFNLQPDGAIQVLAAPGQVLAVVSQAENQIVIRGSDF